MGLEFTTTTDAVDYGSFAAGDNLSAYTLMFTLYLASGPGGGDQRLATKAYFGGAGTYHYLNISNTGADRTVWEWERSTTPMSVIAPFSAFSAYGTGKWMTFAYVLDQSGADADQKILIGDASTPLAEPSSYTSQVVGSGTWGNDAADNWIIGGRGNGAPLGSGHYMDGVHLINRVLTLGEMIDQQYRPHAVSGSLFFSRCGSNGLTSVPDWSGSGNNGTIVSTPTLRGFNSQVGPMFGFDAAAPYEVAAAASSAFPFIRYYGGF